MFRLIMTVCFIMVMSSIVHAEADLKPASPLESAEETFDQRFSIKSALEDLERIESALKSFADLTEASRSKFSEEKLAAIGNTELDTQTLGFMNWPGSIKGTLLKQDYQLKKLNYELAQKNLQSGKIKKDELVAAQTEYLRAKQAFKAFWDSFSIGD